MIRPMWMRRLAHLATVLVAIMSLMPALRCARFPITCQSRPTRVMRPGQSRITHRRMQRQCR